MTGEPYIDYEALAQEAMRGMVRTILLGIAKSGRLPGEHHFYISFATGAPGVVLSRRLKEKYPKEMTVVLQHMFSDLTVTEEHFSVKLRFDGIPERLMVPFTAIKVFFDPSVPYGLQFEASDLAGESHEDLAATVGPASAPRPATARTRRSDGQAAPSETAPTEKRPRAARKPRAERSATEGAPRSSAQSPPAKPAAEQRTTPPRPQLVASNPDKTAPLASEAKVVQLDKFRKK
jgi:uncharacterized protein